VGIRVVKDPELSRTLGDLKDRIADEWVWQAVYDAYQENHDTDQWPPFAKNVLVNLGVDA